MNIFDLFKKIESTSPNANAPIEFLIAGLGNPGKEYDRTRHNVGFVAIDAMAESLSARIDRAKYRALICEVNLGGKRGLLMKPQTFMNSSGEAIREAADFYNVPAENIIVIFDDISLDVGALRIRRKGSAGGHNGIKSVIAHLSSSEFPRIKLGVGAKPSPEYDLVKWVLGNIPEDDRKAMSEAYSRAADALEVMLASGIDTAMNKFSS